MSAPIEVQPLSGMRGFVDGLTGALIDGWAFEPAHPTERVVVDLRLDGQTLATTVADRHRADLMRAGIGDAFHGFRFPLKPAWAERRAELVAVARGLEGGEAPLPLFQRTGPPATSANAQMVKAIERLVAGQRALESQLADIASRREASEAKGEAAPPSTQGEETDQRLAVLEAWVTRLDDQLAQLQRIAAAERVAPAPGIDTWRAVLIALLCVFGLGSLAVFALVLAL